MKIPLVIGFLLLGLSAEVASHEWPDLSDQCSVKGRPANDQDVNSGCAVFVIKGNDDSSGVPMNIEVPQYAFHIDERAGSESPVIVIQAEEKSGMRVIGYKDVGSGRFGAALLREMRLCGTKKPPN